VPHFTILPTDHSQPVVDVTARTAASALYMVNRLDCIEADVLQDGEYAFSVCAAQGGAWTIFQRDWTGEPDEPVGHN
jgi:hypothetical protein